MNTYFMTGNVKSIVYALQPLEKCSKFLGFVVSPSYSNNATNKRLKLFNVLFLTLIMFLNFTHLLFCDKFLDSVDAVTNSLFLLISNTGICQYFFIATYYRKRIFRIVDNLIFIDSNIKTTMKLNQNYARSRTRLLFLLTVVFSSIFLNICIDVAIFGSQSNLNMFDYQCGYFTFTSEILCGLFTCFILFVVDLITSRLICVHNFIRYAKTEHVSPKAFVSTVNIFNCLRFVGKETSVIFQVLVLYKIATFNVVILITAFWFTSTNHIGRIVPQNVMYASIYWILIYLRDILATLYKFTSFDRKAKKTVQLMEDLEQAVGKSNLPYKQVELFSLQVYVEDFKFSVFGCFPLDWTLLHSMVAGVATYLVIFHQFSNMEKKT
ncbi:hypothetical protein FQR65_LT13014 [Abscondita terminalis]|nr:hypothetical protein FQR65_LT13014 [Abscondita terminalis]